MGGRVGFPRWSPSWKVCLGLFVVSFLSATGSRAQTGSLSVGSHLPRPDARLTQLDGSTVPVSDLLGQEGTVFLFWSNQCPWVDRYEERVRRLVEEFKPLGVRFVRVNANDESKAPASLAVCRQKAQKENYQTPYVRDRGASFAKMLIATQTPQAFLFDAQQILVYKGAVDDSPSDPDRVQQPYLRDAISALLRGEDPSVQSTEPFGCTLKYPE